MTDIIITEEQKRRLIEKIDQAIDILDDVEKDCAELRKEVKSI